jgi:outer membrane protein assembly factor BamD
MMKTIIKLSIIVFLLFSGCAWFGADKEKSAEELAGTGMDHYNERRYRKAIESFEGLKDWYPFSKHAILSEIMIADSYFYLKEYEEAILAYEEFETLHPRNEKTPYAVFQVGQCYFAQFDSVDRDQTSALEALDAFRRLKKNYPESPYASRAGQYITQSHKSLAGNELYVARYYYKLGDYRAALSRFQAIISDYPDVGIHQTAIQYIRRCKKAIQKMQAENDQAE